MVLVYSKNTHDCWLKNRGSVGWTVQPTAPSKDAPHPEELFQNLLQLKIEHLQFYVQSKTGIQNEDTIEIAPFALVTGAPEMCEGNILLGFHKAHLRGVYFSSLDPAD